MDKIKQKRKKAGAIKFIAYEKKKAIGRAYLYLIKNDLHKKPYCLLEDVYVDKKYRGRGIGTALVKKIIKKARKMGCYKLIATSRFKRKNVYKFYQRLGLKKFGYEFRLDL